MNIHVDPILGNVAKSLSLANWLHRLIESRTELKIAEVVRNSSYPLCGRALPSLFSLYGRAKPEAEVALSRKLICLRNEPLRATAH